MKLLKQGIGLEVRLTWISGQQIGRHQHQQQHYNERDWLLPRALCLKPIVHEDA